MVKLNFVLILITCLFLLACSDDHNQLDPQAATPQFDFSPAHAWLEQFIDEEAAFDGAWHAI